MRVHLQPLVHVGERILRQGRDRGHFPEITSDYCKSRVAKECRETDETSFYEGLKDRAVAPKTG